MNSFPSPAISTDRLDLREIGPDDLGLLREVAAAGHAEALPPGAQRAWLTANIDNLASVKVAEKAGFRREGTLRRAAKEDDGLHDQAVFSLLDDEI